MARRAVGKGKGSTASARWGVTLFRRANRRDRGRAVAETSGDALGELDRTDTRGAVSPAQGEAWGN